MSVDINTVTITGRLTKDAIIKQFPTSGMSFLEFDVANNTGFGEYAKTQYFKCMLIGDKRSSSLHKWMKKGQQVGITGSLESNNWTDKDGMSRFDWKLKVNDVVLLGGKKQEDQTEPEDIF